MNSRDDQGLVLQGIRQGRPLTGPQTVHIDLTNGCNAACVTCWDHSPLLERPRPASWKRQRLNLEAFQEIVDQLASLGSVRAVVLSGMGEPLTHPDVYEMIGLIKAKGWHITLMSNLVAADIDRLCALEVDQVLVGVQGASPEVHAAFHPGWDERQFFTMCRYLRRLARVGTATRQVQVINQDTAPELVEMVRFGRLFQADRVNFKLASLAEGTQACAVSPDRLAWLAAEAIPAARRLAEELGVRTNLDLFEAQVGAAMGQRLATVPIEEIGCYMGFVYTRITVEQEVLYCCNTEVSVGHLSEGTLAALWWGPRWQALREQLGAGHYLPGCERCGKFEQNRKWSDRLKSTYEQR